MKNYCLLFFIGLALISCGTSTENQTSTSANFHWEITDSVYYEHLGNPILSDVSADGSTFLVFDFSKDSILFINKSGEKFARIKKSGDLPDSYGFLLMPPSLYDNRTAMAIGGKGYHFYNSEGINTRKIPMTKGGPMAAMYLVGKQAHVVTINGQQKVLSKSLRENPYAWNEAAFYTNRLAIDIFDDTSGKVHSIIPFEEGSPFINGKGYIVSDYEPTFGTDGNKLYITHGADPTLYAYQLENDSTATLLYQKPLAYERFESIEALELSSIEPNSVTISGSTPSTRCIAVQGDHLIMLYYGGLPKDKEAELDRIYQSDEKAGEAFYEQLQIDYPNKFYIADKATGEKLAEIPVPDFVSGEGFIYKNGSIWMVKKPNPEVEEESYTYYQIKLVRE